MQDLHFCMQIIFTVKDYWLSHESKYFKKQQKYLEFCAFKSYQGFPGGAVVVSLPANAGHTGSSPGLGRSHVPRSGWARGPQLLSLRVWSLCSTAREAAIMRGPRTAMKSGPHLPQLEKALAQKRRPNTAINKINKYINIKKKLLDGKLQNSCKPLQNWDINKYLRK